MRPMKYARTQVVLAAQRSSNARARISVFPKLGDVTLILIVLMDRTKRIVSNH